MGKTVYLKSYCGICHSLTAAGTRGIFGPSHDHIATTAAKRIVEPGYKGDAHTPVEYVRESILKPAVYVSPGVGNASHPMPPFTQLNQTDLEALVYFLMQQK